MEEWLPLFEIFLNSAAPDAAALLWLQNHRSRRHPTAAFLSLLLSPAPNVCTHHPPPAVLLQTFPPTVQSRILSFLAVHHRCFPHARLRSLAARVLDSAAAPALGPAFWACKAAQHLLDAVPFPASDPSGGAREQLPRGGNEDDDTDLYALPEWLQDSAFAAAPLLPWLPLSQGSLPTNADRSFHLEPQAMELIIDQEDDRQNSAPVASSPLPPVVLDPQVIERISILKAALLASEAAPEAIRLAKEIRQLCLESGNGSQLTILAMVEPWEADDETASVLLANLSGENSLVFTGWHAQILCSIILPRLLSLQKPASRVLLSAAISFCKLHPVAAVEALLFPLALRREGLNMVLCDVLARVIKECLHPVHVSAACQRLLSCSASDRRPVCLPCHQELISDELQWTESMLVLFQHILNHNVWLTPDTVDQIVSVIDEMANKFSRSLKFGNFMLCFVSKCGRSLDLHKVVLEKAAMRTETFVTKSILSKLNAK